MMRPAPLYIVASRRQPRDDPMLREALASSVEQLESALRSARLTDQSPNELTTPKPEVINPNYAHIAGVTLSDYLSDDR